MPANSHLMAVETEAVRHVRITGEHHGPTVTGSVTQSYAGELQTGRRFGPHPTIDGFRTLEVHHSAAGVDVLRQLQFAAHRVRRRETPREFFDDVRRLGQQLTGCASVAHV